MIERTGRTSTSAATRRAVLAGVAGTAVGGSGCLQRARSVVNRSRPAPVSLTIKTVPTDLDPRSILIARFLATKLDEVGIDAQIVPMDGESLLRDVLINQEFEIYVARHPEHHDPDFLRPLLHSRFDSEPGWQNPFGYANLTVDDLLEAQRRESDDDRVQTLREIQQVIAADCPFAVVAFPDDVRALRTDRIDGWSDHSIHTVQSYLRLKDAEADDPTDETAGGTRTTVDSADRRSLQMALLDPRVTKNLNPLTVEFRDRGAITGLLYDSLARWIDGRVVPWLASSWRWLEESDVGAPVAEVELREGLRWHDDEPVTSSDVTFTYEFLADTALGDMDIPVPAPRFRGRSSLVADVYEVDERTVQFRFHSSPTETARRAFTVPLLPEHVWESKATEATVAYIGDDTVTEAIVWGNMDPVGSGPFEYDSSTVNEGVSLVPFEDHFLTGGDLDEPVDRFEGGFSFDRLRFDVVPSGEAAVEMLVSGEVDGIASSIMPQHVPAADQSDAVRIDVERSTSFYHVGFNVRTAPLSNTRFRRAVARLLDKSYLAREALVDYAVPAASPLEPYEAMEPGLVWDGDDPELPFPGEDGELDVEAAREPFIEAGYHYREDGDVIVS